MFITGATGNVGSEVIKYMNYGKFNVIAGVRNIKKAESLFNEEVRLSVFDFEDPSTYDSLKSADMLFLVRPPHISDAEKYIKPVIEAASKCKIEHIVFLSLLGAEKNSFVPHYKIEKYIKSSGIPYTFLRAGFFMQNLNTAHLEEIRDKREILVPAGKGKTSFIDVRDIAEIGARMFEDQIHYNKAYDLTGSEALDYYQVAEILTSVLGRKISYRNPSAINFLFSKLRSGMGFGQAFIMAAIYFTTRIGLACRITHDVSELLKRPPRTLDEYVKDYKSYWQ